MTDEKPYSAKVDVLLKAIAERKRQYHLQRGEKVDAFMEKHWTTILKGIQDYYNESEDILCRIPEPDPSTRIVVTHMELYLKVKWHMQASIDAHDPTVIILASLPEFSAEAVPEYTSYCYMEPDGSRHYILKPKTTTA